MRKHRKSEGFNLAFLDIMACGLGAVILVFMLVKHNVQTPTTESNLLIDDVQQLESLEVELQQVLSKLQAKSRTDAKEIAQLQVKIETLRRALAKKESDLKMKRNHLTTLKNDIANTPIAKKDDLIENERGGEENYLMGLKVEGSRIALLVDSSASMTDESLLEIIKRKNGSASEKKQGPKWLRTTNTVRWLLARIPRNSKVAITYFNEGVVSSTTSNWTTASDSKAIHKLLNKLDSVVPKGATNLQKGLKAVSALRPTDLYLITDGLPTTGDSRYGSLNPFASCSSLLGKSTTISGKCRVKLFRQTIKDSSPSGITINVILLPIEGDPDAVNEYWSWAALTGGLVISPAENWP